MKQINSVKIPEHYVVVRNTNDANLYGITYEGKSKQEVIVEPNYSCVTAFRALGRVFVAYFVDDEQGWVIRNKKGDICSSVPIIDFVACTKCLYGRIPTERGLELAVFDKELNVVKTFGVMTVDDYYTKNGVMVIPNDRKTLDVRDRRGQVCRINMCDNTLDDVISFGSEARVNRNTVEDSDEYVESWQYIVNVSKGVIKKSDAFGNHASVVAEIDCDWLRDNIAMLGMLFGYKPVHKKVSVPVKRHFEDEEHFIYEDVTPEKSKSVESLLRTIPSGEAPDYLTDIAAYAVEYGGGVDLAEYLNKCFKENFKAMNDKYSVKVLTTVDTCHIMVSDGRKVTVLTGELEGVDYGLELTVKSIKYSEKELNGEQGRAIPKPKKHSGKRSSYYKKVMDVKLECGALDYDGNDIEIDIDFLMFTEFTYGPMVGEHKGRYNYTDKNIVLTTTTSDVYLVMD
jgi:hypothetical protein